MNTVKANQKLEVIKSFVNSFLHKKRLVIFIGKNGIKIIVYNKDQVVKSMFAFYNHGEEIISCQEFLKAYKKFEVLILLDSPECQIKHEFMPLLQSIIKFNPAQKFIEDNYPEDHIVTYNVYNIDHNNGETWETAIASSSYTGVTSKLIEFIIHESFQLEGVYFLTLEFEPIIDDILVQRKALGFTNHLQIFTTITEASGIRITTKYKTNILDEITIPFPADKSDLYILGVIGNAIEDKIINYKSYIHSLDLKISLIFLCNKLIGDIIFEKLPALQKYEMVIYTTDTPPETDQSHHFQDSKLLELFVQNKTYVAMNKLIKSITKLTTINSIIFKPLLLTLIGVIVTLGMLKYKALLVQKETTKLNNKYYLLSEKYRNIKKRHPEVENINNLTDLYSLQKILSLDTVTPFEFLQKILSVERGSIELKQVNWYVKNDNFLKNKLSLTIEVQYLEPKKDLKAATQVLNNYINEIKLIFEDCNVTPSIEYDKMVELTKTLTLPATITISTKDQGE